MSALASRSNPLLDALKPEISKLIWQCFDDISGTSIRISILKIPISVKLSGLEGLVNLLVGPRPTET